MNYDLNIWDKVGYETDYAEEGWAITVHAIPEQEAPYGSGEIVTTLDLTPEEAEMLTLGVDRTDGGAYISDSDFFIDLESFWEEYKEVPVRVGAFLRSLSEKEVRTDGLLSLWQEIGTTGD